MRKGYITLNVEDVMDTAGLMVTLESFLKGIERNRERYIQLHDPNRLECIDKKL